MKGDTVEQLAATLDTMSAAYVGGADRYVSSPGVEPSIRPAAPRNYHRVGLQPGQPSLALCFARGGAGRPQRCRIPASGLVLGRDTSAFAEPVRDARMAPRHARVTLEGGSVIVKDLGAPAGVRVNGEAVLEQVLRPGDVLRLGDTLLVYTLEGPEDPGPDGGLVGTSGPIAAVRRSVDAVAARRHAVVITGETGTGKEVVARLLHERSGRAGPFIAVNCSTFTEALLSSELFGHVRGAFTGAVTEHTGLFRAARGGTLLLDEMTDIPLQVQAFLLRVLETRSVRPVGATRDIEVDVRVVATTNRELVDMVQQGRFRADLYARLAQWTIHTPRLRERRDDIPELTAHLLPRVDGADRRLDPDLAEALLLHEWPLNVRGLLNILSIAVVSAEDDGSPLTLTPEVQEALWWTRSMAPEQGVPLADLRRVEAAEPVWEPPRTLDRDELEQLMVRFQGHVAAAARHVGMTRPKLYRMLGAHGLEPSGFRRSRGRGC